MAELFMISDGKALNGLWFKGQKYFMLHAAKEYIFDDKLPIFQTVFKWLDDYFLGKKPALSKLFLDPKGSAFQKTVWQSLLDIGYGKTVTYGELAAIVAFKLNKKSMSAQAVGGAVGYNPISIIIPCHRVLGKDKKLTGYAAGLQIKAALLSLEGIDFCV